MDVCNLQFWKQGYLREECPSRSTNSSYLCYVIVMVIRKEIYLRFCGILPDTLFPSS